MAVHPASNDFCQAEPGAPVFGTLKASFYAMVFAVPRVSPACHLYRLLHVGGAAHVKPTVEIMAPPTVIPGFLAGLWLAPIIEGPCPG